MILRTLKAADLFCGAGGTSAGLLHACQTLNRRVELTAVNHWDTAIATHTKNHPTSRHLCATLDSLNPRSLYREGELDLLWASPECTHHSNARGGKPIRDQSRATAWCVVRWAEALRPSVILVENVKEFRNWGPLIRKRVRYKWRPVFKSWHKRHCPKLGLDAARQQWRAVKPIWKKKLDYVPDPKRKGVIFLSWLSTLEAIGYKVEHRVLCCADYGDPTTRERLFVMCVRKPLKLVWPDAVFGQLLKWPRPEMSDSLFNQTPLRPWVSARDGVIDWTIKGRSIFERKKPLAYNTLRRIMIGFERGLTQFLLSQQSGGAPRGLDEPVSTVCTSGRIQFVESVVKLRGTGTVVSPNQPSPAVTAGGNHLGVMEPSMVEMKGNSTVRSVDDPLSTATGVPYHGVMEPKLVEVNHGKDGAKSDNHRVKDVDKPFGSVTGSRGTGLIEFIMQTDQTGGNGAYVREPTQPIFTVVTKQNMAVCEAKLTPHIVGAGGPSGSGEPVSVDQPMHTILGTSCKGIAEPFILPHEGVHKGNAARSVKEPLPTVTASHTHHLVEPKLEPEIVKFYGSGISKPVDETLDAVTTKERFGLAEFSLKMIDLALLGSAGRKPILEIDGRYYVLDILFRMLNYRELARAQGFRDDYQFTGSTEDVVKQIGNAVPRRTAAALVRAVLSQNSDVTSVCLN